MASKNGNGNTLSTKDDNLKLEQNKPENFTKAFDSETLFEQGFATEITVAPKVGDGFTGLYLGPGPDIEKTDEESGEVTFLKTWLVQAISGLDTSSGKPTYQIAKVKARVIGSYNLNQFLMGVTPGNTIVACRFISKEQVGARQVNRWDCRQLIDPAIKATGLTVSEQEQAARRTAKAEVAAQGVPAQA